MTSWFTKWLGTGSDRQGLRFWEIIAMTSFAIGTIVIAIYGVAVADGLRAFAILESVACAAWGCGSILGFLFGVPRLRTATGPQAAVGGASQFTPNTNLEQISDWLTKIIVGATLVQLNPLLASLQTAAQVIGDAIGAPHAAALGGAVMISFFTAGFMWGYLWCSLRIFREMIFLTGQGGAGRTKPREDAAPGALAAGDGGA